MYQLQSIDSLMQYINAKNPSANLVKGDLTFSNPKVVAGTWMEGTTSKNTAIQLTAKPSAVYQGSKVFMYDRLNLASLASIAGVQIKANNPTSTYSILKQLRYFSGVDLTTDDVEDLPIQNDGNGNLTVVISAKTTSVGWVGSVSLPVTAGGSFIDQDLTNPDLQGLNYPTNNPGTDIMSSVYLYGYDFTTYVADLIDLQPGVISDTVAGKLVTALQTLDVSSGKALWNASSSSTTWSLQGATVVSNGLNSSSLPTNQSYKYVLALDLRNGVTTPVGRLYFHYNDPFNPNDF
jgi:hypothetical protein